MKKRTIGNTELKITPFVLGGNVFGWTADEKESHKILDKFVSEGFEMIDTANSYSYWAPGNMGGDSERVIGSWLKKRGKRKDVLIATKVGGTMPDQRNSLKAAYIREQVENSLKFLQTDYIDLYYTHYDDLNTSVEETLSVYTELVKEGKIRYIATSNMSVERIRESMEVSKEKGLSQYVALQPEYNLSKRKQYETEYQPIVEEYGLGVLTYFSLASGFLTGKYKTVEDLKKGSRASMLADYADQRGECILKALHAVAGEYKATPAQIALAWILANPSVTAPIASVSNVEQMDILQAVNIELSKEAVDKLNEASKY